MKYAILLLLLIASICLFSQGHSTQNWVIQTPDQMAEFPGGQAEMWVFIKGNFQYPDVLKEKKIEGEVIIDFVVGVNGRISNVEVRKGLDPAIDEEAVRVIQSMPDFKPASLKGQPVRAKLTLPMIIELDAIQMGTSDPASQYKKACSFIKDGNYEVAKNYLEQSADQHYPPALTQLGLLYKNGKGVSIDYDLSMKYISEAADSGYATALLEMGIMNEKGEGVPVDSTMAVMWYRRAAEQGSLAAQNKMGNIYNKGTTVVPRDMEEAMKWYDMAAKQHNPDALNNYAWLCYLKKENIEKGIEYIKEALEKTPDDIHRLDTYASLLFLHGSYEDAEKTEKKALDGGGDQKAGYLEKYGDIQIMLGNKDEAIKYWKMAQELKGHSDKLAEKLSTEKYVE